MPAQDAPEEPRGRSMATILFWVGVGLAPVAALLLLIGQSNGPLRIAAVLAIVAVVLIGLSITLRSDAESVRLDLEENLLQEIDELRAELRQEIANVTRASQQAFGAQLQPLRANLELLRGQLNVDRADPAAAAASGIEPARPGATGVAPGRAGVAVVAASRADALRPRGVRTDVSGPGPQPDSPQTEADRIGVARSGQPADSALPLAEGPDYGPVRTPTRGTTGPAPGRSAEREAPGHQLDDHPEDGSGRDGPYGRTGGFDRDRGYSRGAGVGPAAAAGVPSSPSGAGRGAACRRRADRTARPAADSRPTRLRRRPVAVPGCRAVARRGHRWPPGWYVIPRPSMSPPGRRSSVRPRVMPRTAAAMPAAATKGVATPTTATTGVASGGMTNGPGSHRPGTGPPGPRRIAGATGGRGIIPVPKGRVGDRTTGTRAPPGMTILTRTRTGRICGPVTGGPRCGMTNGDVRSGWASGGQRCAPTSPAPNCGCRTDGRPCARMSPGGTVGTSPGGRSPSATAAEGMPVGGPMAAGRRGASRPAAEEVCRVGAGRVGGGAELGGCRAGTGAWEAAAPGRRGAVRLTEPPPRRSRTCRRGSGDQSTATSP